MAQYRQKTLLPVAHGAINEERSLLGQSYLSGLARTRDGNEDEVVYFLNRANASASTATELSLKMCC